MNLKQLRYFKAAADRGCMTLAAADVHVAQSAISSQIAGLEAELGTRLLVRHGRGVSLTEPGRVLLDHARRIDEAVIKAKREVQAAGSAPQEVAIGIPVSISAALTLPLMRAIETALPGARVRIFEGLTGDLRGWLRSGKIETAILYSDDDADGLQLVPLADDELVLFGAGTDLHVQLDECVSFNDLSRLALFTTDEDHPVRPLLTRLARAQGIDLKFAGKINSVQQLKALAGSGQGYTILPKVALAAELTAALALIHSIRPPILMRSYVASSGRPSRLLALIKKTTAELIDGCSWPGATILP